jgi:hypothetical protein
MDSFVFVYVPGMATWGAAVVVDAISRMRGGPDFIELLRMISLRAGLLVAGFSLLAVVTLIADQSAGPHWRVAISDGAGYWLKAGHVPLSYADYQRYRAFDIRDLTACWMFFGVISFLYAAYAWPKKVI